MSGGKQDFQRLSVSFRAILSAIFLIAFASTKSQSLSTGYFSNKHQRLATKDTAIIDNAYYILNDTLSYNSGSIIQSVMLFNPELVQKIIFKNCIYSYKNNITIDSCFFITNDTFPLPENCDGNDPTLSLQGGFIITNSHFTDDLSVRNVAYSTQAGYANINYNHCSNIDLSYNKCRLMNVMQNEISGQFSFSWSQSDVTAIANNYLADSSKSFNIDYSNFKISLQVLNNNCEKLSLNEDTVSGILNFVFSKTINSLKQKVKKQILVKNSLINAKCYTDIDDSLFESKLIFDNCSFGNSASMFNLKVDTIIFRNCTNIPFPLFLTTDTSKHTVFIELINSNVNNIRFDYTDKFKLFFESSVSEETKNNTYQSLLAKYKSEGKPENIEKIDIEYKRYQYKSNWLMWPIWLLDYIWWRYGYSKWLIVVWTLVFLSIFFYYNFKNWEGMRKMYSVFDKDDLSLLGIGKNENRFRKKLVYVLLYTSFIFFSLRVDFDKLKYANNRFLASFFTQYIVGLICLFFLANAIFKLG